MTKLPTYILSIMFSFLFLQIKNNTTKNGFLRFHGPPPEVFRNHFRFPLNGEEKGGKYGKGHSGEITTRFIA